jgi:hypothetical protein
MVRVPGSKVQRFRVQRFRVQPLAAEAAGG